LRNVVPAPGLFPTYFVPARRADAERKFASFLDREPTA
jgi:hypothetical protein